MIKSWKKFCTWLDIKTRGQQSYIPWKCTFCGATGLSRDDFDADFWGSHFHREFAERCLERPCGCFYCGLYTVYPNIDKIYCGAYDPRMPKECHVYLEGGALEN